MKSKTCPVCGNVMNRHMNFVYDGVMMHPNDIKRRYVLIEYKCSCCNTTISGQANGVIEAEKGANEWFSLVEVAKHKNNK